MDVIAEEKLLVQTKILPGVPTEGEKAGLLKKQYQKPILKTYGPVRLWTQGSGGMMGDGQSGMNRA